MRQFVTSRDLDVVIICCSRVCFVNFQALVCNLLKSDAVHYEKHGGSLCKKDNEELHFVHVAIKKNTFKK